MGAAAHRARLRGEVRPPAGRPLPPRDALPALASGQAAGGVPLRPARGHDALRACRRFSGRRRSAPSARRPYAPAAPRLPCAASTAATRLRLAGALFAYCGGHGASPCARRARARPDSSSRRARASTALPVDARVPVADLGEARGHGREREIGRVGMRRPRPSPAAPKRAHRASAAPSRRRDGAVLRVLVVVDEHAVPLLLPPLAGRERRHAPLDLARERQRRAAHLVEASSAARCARARAGRACPRSWASRAGRSRRASLARRAPRRAPATTSRRARDRDRCAARRDDRDPPRAPDADAARGTRGSPSTRAPAASRGTISSAVRPEGKLHRHHLDPRRARLRRALLEEEFAARCRSDSAPACWAARPPPRSAPVRDAQVVANEVQLGVAGLREQHLVRIGDDDLTVVDEHGFGGRGGHRVVSAG